MITERQLASKYSSLWAELLPMSDRFMRRLNLESIRYIEPFTSTLPPKYNALVNELSFRIYQYTYINGSVNDQYESLLLEVKSFIESLSGEPLDIDSDLLKLIRIDSLSLSERINDYFTQSGITKNLTFDPEFQGCGIIDKCYGDIKHDDVLYEIKAGQREFRAVDLRQLFVYLALNNQSKDMELNKVSLVNPRTGKYWIGNIEETFYFISGVTPSEIFSELIEFVSHDRLSH